MLVTFYTSCQCRLLRSLHQPLLRDASLAHRPIAEKYVQLIYGFPQNEDGLFFLYPKAIFLLTASRLQNAIAQRSDSTAVTLGGIVVAFGNFYRRQAVGLCAFS
jgi:hypothetical protein